MNQHETMQVGTLTLRKTDDGWQYRSEGDSAWNGVSADAAREIGPFSGSGVGDLLDELLAARKELDSRSVKVCKNCRHWRDGCCDFINTICGEKVAKTTGCSIDVTALVDSGLCVELRTGPDFSCPSFNQ